LKKVYFFVFLLVICSVLTLDSFAQKIESGKQITRCATMQRLEKLFSNDLLSRAAINQRNNNTNTGTFLSTYRLNSIVTIPVVVHIVLPNPYVVTDADVQSQIDRLNLDFAGLNGDSSNASANFLALRGHSQIQFCLAKRTPGGQISSGIERRASVTTSSPLNTADPIKYQSMGGLDQWDPGSYLNLWIGDDDGSGEILGYAHFPGTTPIEEDGVFINYRSWGSSTCYTLPEYNKGRSATHEIGHYLGLMHIWGDDNGCSGDDFRNLTEVQSTCSLPPGLFNPTGKGNTSEDIGDTPNQGGETTNCSVGEITDACATTTPGKMYQNFMDYSLDACLTMFTKKQVERMEWVLDHCRGSLKLSAGCQPPASAITRDASPLESVNPGGIELIGCTSKNYSSVVFCAGSFVPKVRIINNSSTLLTTVTAGYQIDNGTTVTKSFTVNLTLGASTVVSFDPISVSAGAHDIRYFTSNPNGNTDQVPANDTITASFIVNGTTTVPFTESFISAAFPPANWSVINPDGGITWQRHEAGKNNPGSAYVNTFNYDKNNEVDDLVSPRISFNPVGIDSIKLSFDLAAATYSDPSDPSITMDTLQILVSTDCGNTFTSVYKKWGKDLRTVDSPLTEEFIPTPEQWRKENVDLSGFSNQSPIQLFFRLTNNFENNIFIDNVNVITSAVPALLKSQGYLVLPNPFRQNFVVWHYHQPTDLRFIRVYNLLGQVMWTQEFKGNADTYITIDLSGKPAGIYFVRMEYLDGTKNFTQQIVKY
jgi:hypothetical protein